MILKDIRKKIYAGVVLLLAATLVFCAVAVPQVQASDYKASYIKEYEGKLDVNYEQFLDGSVMQVLPDTIREDQQISVIVTVDETDLMSAYAASGEGMTFAQFAKTEEARALTAAVSQRKAALLQKLDDAGVAYTAGEEYSTVLTGFELVIRAGDYTAMCKSFGSDAKVIVGEEYKTCETQLVENIVNVYDTGIFNSAQAGYDGSGMVVAVLDTGLDSKHTAFSVDNFTSDHLGLTYEDVAAVMSDTTAATLREGLTVNDVYINEKVPFGFDYADEDPDVYSTHNNHGTHVSGVIVGKDDVITGVAPNAQLVSMKIFSDVMDTARSAWILAALEDCVVLGVDVVNMSLGTACGFSHESEEEMMNGVYDKLREAGISIVVAASNSYASSYGSEANGNLGLTSNPDTGTVGSPSTYKGALSVASINGTETPYLMYGKTIIYFDEANSGAAEELHFFDTLLGDADEKEYEYVVIPGVGRSADYTGMEVAGKIALVRRGDNTFEEKAMIAEKQGAAGIIIYNNVSGDIKMNVGDAKLAVCSISQDDGELLAKNGNGKLTIKRSQTSGPFMTDFSSWGPTPDLQIKPEITAHGGNILSSITGGGYDRLSGTSMACPNLAGVVVLLRQYVVENFPQIAHDNVQVSALVNQLMMSTADIVFNTNGEPYSVRKQGAGLANLMNALNTTAYITTKDASGAVMDKTKIELGDDPEKTGVYKLSFTVVNFGDEDQTYTINTHVFTEGVSDTKTNSGATTVTEVAYALEDTAVEISCGEQGGKLKGDSQIVVNAGQSLDVTMTLTLSDAAKTYLDGSFENGMYVEGYVTLDAKDKETVDLSVPYLAFYGDWTVAPMFDRDYYETNPDELDDALSIEDKTMADAYATRPIGGVTGDYVTYLGTYYFLQNPEDIAIPANRDYISLSNQDGAIHALRYVWAGLLRAADKMEVTITDEVTGEVIFETVDDDVRKSYGDGGSIYPANVEIEFDAQDYNLVNNSRYNVKLTGYMDYRDGALDTNKKNTFEFPLTIDFEAPTLSDVEFYYEYDKTLEKNRLYAKMAVYDNHHAMSAQVGYVANGTDADGNPTPEMLSFDQFMTPVYSERNSTTYVTYELTDYIYQIKENSMNTNSFVVTLYDYALNYATFEVGLPDDFVDFYFEDIAQEGLTLSPNEVFSLEPRVYPESAWSELLEFASSKPGVARVVNNKIVAVAPGASVIRVRDPQTNESITFKVTVLSENDEGYRRYDKPVADMFRLDGYETINAYYIVNNEDKDIGDTGNIRYFNGKYDLLMYPSESVRLNHTLDAYFPNDTTVEYESSNESIVTIDQNGVVTGVAQGFASVTVKVMLDGKSTYYSESVSVEIKDPWLTNGASLQNYYGLGGVVTIPEELSLTEIGNFAFANYDYVEKTEEELAFDDAETMKQWYIGNSTITKVIIPEGIEKINAYAFANLTALEEIVLPSTMEAIEYGAFYGCTALEKITFSSENNLKIINQNAFENCNIQGTLDLSAACVISDYAFAGNQELEGVVTSQVLQSIGEYAFAGCKDLESVTIEAPKVKYGPYAFTGCESLQEFYVNAAVLPEGMFYEAKGLKSVTVGPEVNDIGAFAFRDTAVEAYTVSEGNKTYKVQSAGYILSADGTALVAVSPTLTGAFTAENIGGAKVTAVAGGAFSHNTKLTSVVLPQVTTVGAYGFGSSERLEAVQLGQLTFIGEYAFFETAIKELPAFTAQTQIERYAFAYTDITSVTVPDGMTVAEGVFSECTGITDVTVGNDVILDKYAFFVSVDNAFQVLNYDENDEKYFYYSFATGMNTLSIGSNVTIGENAFANNASLTAVTLGEGAKIGKQAFYNCSSLAQIDLSKALTVGDYAFSGDEYYICLDENMSVAAVSPEGEYMTTDHAPQLTRVDLSCATELGEYAFALQRSLSEVVLGEGITQIKQYTFAGCTQLGSIDLSRITAIGEYAFMENEALTFADLTAAETIGKYAFVDNANLSHIKLNTSGAKVNVEEGAFAYCSLLQTVEGMDAVTYIGDWAFAYSGLRQADVMGAEHIGTQAFAKEVLTDFPVCLGNNLKTLGDNPFAYCKVMFVISDPIEFNGVSYDNPVYTFDFSDSVCVIDGSLYCRIDTGLVLITYGDKDAVNAKLADGTVRISSMAFAGSDVQMVTLPHSVKSIGHKAFFDCDALHTLVFTSYDAPILEEEYDPKYYETFDHLPGSGDYGTYTDYDGTEVPITGTGMLPYYMWNATDGMYSNVFYGASFVDYVGFVPDKLTMVRPANGQNYDSYIYGQYFDITIDGAAAADAVTLQTIAAIKAIPERVTYEDKALVEAARAMYSRIATLEQQALVTNYADLISAEQRIVALTPTDTPVDAEPAVPKETFAGWIVAIVAAVIAAAGAVTAVLLQKKKKAAPAAGTGEAEAPEAEVTEEAATEEAAADETAQ